MEKKDQDRIQALASFLDCKKEELKHLGDNTFGLNGREYLVLTDEEANELVEEYITNSLWVFNASFILEHTKIEWDEKVEKAFRKMQDLLSEDANIILTALIDNMDDFISDAIEADGRRHFIDSYDGVEHEEGDFFIYRIN